MLECICNFLQLFSNGQEEARQSIRAGKEIDLFASFATSATAVNKIQAVPVRISLAGLLQVLRYFGASTCYSGSLISGPRSTSATLHRYILKEFVKAPAPRRVSWRAYGFAALRIVVRPYRDVTYIGSPTCFCALHDFRARFAAASY